MALKRITELTEEESPQPNDFLLIERVSGETYLNRKVRLSTIAPSDTDLTDLLAQVNGTTPGATVKILASGTLALKYPDGWHAVTPTLNEDGVPTFAIAANPEA